MTFRQQVGRTLVWSLRAVGVGFVLVWLAIFLEVQGRPTGQAMAGIVGAAMMVSGAVLGGLGVVLRPVHRHAVRRGWLRGGTGRAAQFWLWQDAQGRDRDL